MLDIPVTVTSWELFLPEAVRGYWFTGNLQRNLQVAGFLPEPGVFAQVGGKARLSNNAASQEDLSKSEPQFDQMLRMVASKPSSAPVAREFREKIGELQERGVLPFQIAIPRSGHVVRFGRLLTTGEPLTLRVRYLKNSVMPLVSGGVGLLGFLGVGGLFRKVIRRRR
jgi:hypothetical protein